MHASGCKTIIMQVAKQKFLAAHHRVDVVRLTGSFSSEECDLAWRMKEIL